MTLMKNLLMIIKEKIKVNLMKLKCKNMRNLLRTIIQTISRSQIITNSVKLYAKQTQSKS